MGIRVSYKVDQSAEFIRTGIASHRFASGSALPPIKRLAVLAGVSVVTMWKAVQILKQEGLLQVIPGQVIKVSGPGEERCIEAVSPPLPRPSRQIWHRIKDEMTRDILTGEFGIGSMMPLVKELKSRYRTSSETIAKAQAAMCGDGLIRASGRRYEVSRPSAAVANAAVCVVVDREYVDQYIAGPPEAQHDYLHTIEIHGSKTRIKVLTAECTFKDDQLVPIDTNALTPVTATSQSILGYIYLLGHISASKRLFNLFKICGKPVSVLDQDGMPELAQMLGGNPLFSVFPVGSGTMPGRTVGRYLLGLGHKDIAYFSPWGSHDWSMNRLRGLEEIYAKAGYANAVRRCVLPMNTWFNNAMSLKTPDVSSISPTPGKEQMVHDRRTRYQMQFASDSSPKSYLWPLFEQALKDARITAWVTANDHVATMALDFLEQQRIRVPQRISVVAFDDTAAAIVCRLTSHNFNLSAIVNAAFRHILDFPQEGRRAKPRNVEIEGFVVERDSAASAGGGGLRQSRR